MIGSRPDCLDCQHYHESDLRTFTCEAFPNGIPDIIIMGKKHLEPLPEQDNDFVFEAITDIIYVKTKELVSRRHLSVSITETLREISLSESFPEGKASYFRNRIHQLKQQMTQAGVIADNWVTNGCLSIDDPKWLAEVIRQELQHRPDDDVWDEASSFIRQYCRIKQYDRYTSDSGSDLASAGVLDDTETAHLTLIYSRFKDEIDEPLSQWLQRFVYPNDSPVAVMSLEKDAKEGSRRLVILAILHAIKEAAGNKYDFTALALERFGIRGFRKAISTHKNKPDFKKVVEACNKILKT